MMRGGQAMPKMLRQAQDVRTRSAVSYNWPRPEPHPVRGSAGTATTPCYNGVARDAGTGSAMIWKCDVWLLEPAPVFATVGNGYSGSCSPRRMLGPIC